MPPIHNQRMTAEMDGDFVVFLIGMHINKPWKIHKWLPVFLVMLRMIRELYAHPELGFLSHTLALGFVVQYWRSFEHLEAYARNKDHRHPPAWSAFQRQLSRSGDVGIWHETYCIAPGHYETFYSNMPAFGLGKVGRLVPATEQRERARARREHLSTPE
jgi:Domain of unknown function (DUF4188)